MSAVAARVGAARALEWMREHQVASSGVTGALRYFICDLLAQYGEQRLAGRTLNGDDDDDDDLSSSTGSTMSITGTEDSTSTPASLFAPDWRRTSVFTTFAFLYGVGPGYLFYNRVYPAVFGKRHLAAVLVDSIFTCTLTYYPLFYCVQDGLTNGFTTRSPADLVRSAMVPWKANMFDDVAAMFAFWVPVNYLNFRFVPLAFRLPVMSATGAIWAIILSAMRGGGGEEGEAGGGRGGEGGGRLSGDALEAKSAKTAQPA